MSNLTKRPVVQKGQNKPKGNQPTMADRKRWERIRQLGCLVKGCGQPAAIHHCGTGRGGRKNHKMVIPLCYKHHQSDEAGLHRLGRTKWGELFGTEEYHLERVKLLLGER